MKLGVDIVGDIARIMEAETLAGEKAVTAAMREASTGLKTAWRAQITGAGLGARLLSGSYYGQTVQIWTALFMAAALAAALVGVVGLVQRLVLGSMGLAK